MQKHCRRCGKAFEAAQTHYQYCSTECRRAAEHGVPTATPARRPAPPPGPQPVANPAAPALPDQYIFKSFYDADRQLLRGVYLETARDLANQCAQEGLTTTQLRQLFFMLKAEEQRLRADASRNFGLTRDTLYRFARQVAYQQKRNVLKSRTFVQWVEKHLDLACKSPAEFRGFVECLTSIVAYLAEKEERR